MAATCSPRISKVLVFESATVGARMHLRGKGGNGEWAFTMSTCLGRHSPHRVGSTLLALRLDLGDSEGLHLKIAARRCRKLEEHALSKECLRFGAEHAVFEEMGGLEYEAGDMGRLGAQHCESLCKSP